MTSWLDIIRELKAIAQTGLTYTEGKYDRERYERLRELTAVIAAQQTNGSVAELRGLFATENGYPTPKIDVRGAVFRDDKILLVREIADQNRWTLPGGWADVGASPSTAVVKEVFEESGFHTRAVKMIAMLDRDHHPHPKLFAHIYKIFFLCDIMGGQAATSIETSEVRFFGEEEIPADLSIARVLPEQIKLCFEHHRNLDLPTVFD